MTKCFIQRLSCWLYLDLNIISGSEADSVIGSYTAVI